VWDEKTQQFAHPSGIVVVTPDGRLARYFFGIEYASRDVKFALIESSAGRIGNANEQLLLYCYHYNPATGKYGAVIANVLRIAAGITMVIVGAFVFIMFRKDLGATHGQTERIR
jgi:protein SCO1/2